MAEARWLAGGTPLPSRLYPSGGRTFVLAHKGLGESRGGARDLPKAIEGILRLRGDCRTTESRRKARDRGVPPDRPVNAGPAGGVRAGRAHTSRSRDPWAGIPWEGRPPHEGEEIVVDGERSSGPPGRKGDVSQLPRELDSGISRSHPVKDLPSSPADPEKAYRGKRSGPAAR